MMTTKRCPAHDGGKGRVLPISEFHIDRNAVDGHQTYCKPCLNDRRRRRYALRGPSLRDSYGCLQTKAKIAGVQFEISFQDYSALVSRPCIYGGATRPKINVGIDRKDPAGGYTLENCVPCCPLHNLIKRDNFRFESMVRIVKEFPEARECGDQVRRKPRKFTRSLS